MTQESNKPVEMLAACPFCGASAKLVKGYWNKGAWHPPKIICANKHTFRGFSLFKDEGDGETDRALVEQWNTRLSSTPTADREAVLEEARRALIQNKRVNDAIQSALERGELHISDEGYLAVLTTSPSTAPADMRGLVSALSDIADDFDQTGNHWKANRCREAASALSRTPAVTDEAQSGREGRR
jgi:hypothetical protein